VVIPLPCQLEGAKLWTNPGTATAERLKGGLPAGASGYCGKCELVQPARCYHCGTCGRCVLLRDHHCPWIDNCIGAGNR
jgi:hypothetical protein